MSATLRIGATAPDFKAQTQLGPLNFHSYIEGSWAILFSHPKDFTPVCTTELGTVAKLQPEFKKRGVKTIALSVDSAESHKKWIKDINEIVKVDLQYPIIADEDRKIATTYNMLDPDWVENGLPLTVRSVFIIDPNKKIKVILTYPAATGRNFDELLRVIDSLQMTVNHKCATPADWKKGDDVVVLPSVKTDDAKKIFGSVNEVRPWLRTTADPTK